MGYMITCVICGAKKETTHAKQRTCGQSCSNAWQAEKRDAETIARKEKESIKWRSGLAGLSPLAHMLRLLEGGVQTQETRERIAEARRYGQNRKCAVCGATFMGWRPAQITCSTSCATKLYHRKKKAGTLTDTLITG